MRGKNVKCTKSEGVPMEGELAVGSGLVSAADCFDRDGGRRVADGR